MMVLQLNPRNAPLLVRNEQHTSSTMINLLITLLALILLSLVLTITLYTARTIRRRQAANRQPILATHDSNPNRNHPCVSITSRNSVLSIYGGNSPDQSKPATSATPDNVPEIRITFPDEQDESGRTMSGRVVVVRVGEAGIGLEPLHKNEQLPAYKEKKGDQFQSIDIERIGGLQEKTPIS